VTLGLSPAEAAFVEALIELGEPAAAAAIAGTQPSLARDPRIQSALVDQIHSLGAVDAVYARKVLYDLAKSADLDSVRLRAATTLWERGLGKIPDQVNIDVNLHSVDRASLYAEIRLLIDQLGLPPAIEGDFIEVERSETPIEEPLARSEEPIEAALPAADPYTPDLPPKWR
jgi:hypothetical protein